MAREQVEFTEINPETLTEEQQLAWAMYLEAKAGFKATLQSLAPNGKKVVFTEKYNKLKIALVSGPKEKSKAMSLADYLAEAAAR